MVSYISAELLATAPDPLPKVRLLSASKRILPVTCSHGPFYGKVTLPDVTTTRHHLDSFLEANNSLALDTGSGVMARSSQ